MDRRRYILPVTAALVRDAARDVPAYLQRLAAIAAEDEAGGVWDAVTISGPFTPQSDEPYPPDAQLYVVTVVSRT